MEKKTEVTIVSMGETAKKLPVLEHCCYGLEEDVRFHNEIYLFYFALKKKGINVNFLNGNFMDEEVILEKLSASRPEKIIYYLFTPSIRTKENFMRRMSEISELHLVITPFFWREKILKEYPFVKDVHYDGEKIISVDLENTKINYEEIDLTPYMNGKLFLVIVSKYCPYQCTFCNARKTGYMLRNLEIVKDELTYLKSRGFKKFLLNGDILTLRRDVFLKICEMMEELDVEWSGDGRVDHMSEEMYEPIKRSHGTILFGVESANQEILNKILKKTTIEQVIKNADRLNRVGVHFRYTVMFGFPWDSYETFKEMLTLRKRVGALNYHCNVLAPYPGMPVFEEMKRLNLVNENELDFGDFVWSNMPIAPTLHLSKEEIVALNKKIMLQGVLNKSVIKHIITKRKIKEYPLIGYRGLQLLIHGKRTWRT